MLLSDWSSDVCSSDLDIPYRRLFAALAHQYFAGILGRFVLCPRPRPVVVRSWPSDRNLRRPGRRSRDCRLRQARRYATGSQPGVAFAARVDFGNRRAVFWLYDAFLARARAGGPGIWPRRVLAQRLSASRLFDPFERDPSAYARPDDIDPAGRESCRERVGWYA